MLTINIPSSELYDEEHNEFIQIPSKTLKLEHSLISLSKWESKWNVPFLDPNKDKTTEQTLDYMRCMVVGPVPDKTVFYGIPSKTIKQIVDYIDAPMTATTFGGVPNSRKTSKTQILTSELIYYDMIALGIPMECEKWHLNRLFTLIRVCSIKNQPNNKKNKMSKDEIRKRNSALNAQRKAKLHTKG